MPVPLLTHRSDLRKRATHVGVRVFLVGQLNDKDDVVLGFEGRDDGTIAGLVSNGFAVNGCDDRGLAETDLISKGAGTNAGNNHAAFDASLCRECGWDGGDGNTEFAFSCICFLWGGRLVLLASDVSVGFGAVTDQNIGGVLFAITQITDLDG